jgi:hypothetical protein
MGDYHHLVIPRQIGEKFGQGSRGRPTQPGVYLVEKQAQSTRRPAFPQNRPDREMDARQLATGGNPSHRAWLLAGVGGNQEDALFDTARVERN